MDESQKKSSEGQSSLAHLNLAAGLDEGGLAVLSALSARQFVAKGDCVVSQGAEDDALYGVLSGSIVVKSADGRLVSVLGEADTFGEIGFLTGCPRTADVFAQSDAILLRLPGPGVRALLDDQPAIAARLYANVAQELATRLTTTTEMALL